jgi:WD40 repeat protein
VKLYLDDPAEDWFCFATLSGHTSTVWSVAWAPCGRYLASASDDRTIRLWKRVEEHKWVCVGTLGGHARTIYAVSWGPAPGADGAQQLGWLASAGGDGRINVWELEVRCAVRCVVRLC